MKRMIVLAGMVVACTSPLEIDVVPVDVTGDPIVSPASPGEFRVTVENRGTQEVAWGTGSSSCRLGLAVLLDDARAPIGDRMCTADIVVHLLEPGGSRTETITWDGRIVAGDEMVALPPGRYQIVGAAGRRASSQPIWVDVIED